MFESFLIGLRKRVTPFIDPTVLILFGLGIGILLLIDPVMVKTLVEWGLFFLALAAVAVIVSRLVFPHVELKEWLEEARKGNPAAGHVLLMIGIFMSGLVIAIAIWAKV